MSPSKSKFWYSKSNLHFSKLAVSLTVFKKCQTPAYFPVTKKKLLNIDTRNSFFLQVPRRITAKKWERECSQFSFEICLDKLQINHQIFFYAILQLFLQMKASKGLCTT